MFWLQFGSTAVVLVLTYKEQAVRQEQGPGCRCLAHVLFLWGHPEFEEGVRISATSLENLSESRALSGNLTQAGMNKDVLNPKKKK